ncbi:glycosyltransferase [bacterium]|nr:glycosyltransferase [bacterium]
MTKKSKYFFSVIVPAHNRKEELKELLASLEKQTLPKNQFEVIIVDDHSTDGSDRWLHSIKNELPFKLIIERLTGKDRFPGPARNRGMERASGDFFVFIDSDCIAPPEWLHIIDETLKKDSSIKAFGGRDDADADFSPLLKAINYSMTSFISTGGMRGGKKKRLAKFYPRSFNMGIRRKLYETTDNADGIRFSGLRHGQDILFSHQIMERVGKEKIKYIPDSVVFHKRRTSIIKFFKQVFNWGVARINLSRIDPVMLEPLHFAPALGLWVTLLFALFAFLFPSIFTYWIRFIIIVVVLLLGSGVHAALKWKSTITGLLVPVVMVIQITGYGLGFTSAFIWRVLLKKGVFAGFVKRYYK